MGIDDSVFPFGTLVCFLDDGHHETFMCMGFIPCSFVCDDGEVVWINAKHPVDAMFRMNGNAHDTNPTWEIRSTLLDSDRYHRWTPACIGKE